MSKILDWIKKHVWQTVLIGFGLFILPLILVHFAYRIPAISPWFASTWESGELITYFAGFEAFIGTIFLGFVATRQNEEANEISNRVFNHELRRSIYEYIPKIDVSTKASENETWGKLFWGDRPFFSGRESLLLRGRPASFNEKFPVVLQTITLTQKSSYDLDVSITQFQLFARDNNLYVTTIELNNLLPFDSEKSMKRLINSLDISFAHSRNLYMETDEIFGKLAVEIKNDLRYRYDLLINFSLKFQVQESDPTQYWVTIEECSINPIFEI